MFMNKFPFYIFFYGCAILDGMDLDWPDYMFSVWKV